MNVTKELYDKLCALKHAYIGEDGKEYNNPTPIDVPMDGLKRPKSLKEQVQKLLRQELSVQAMAQGFESFDESQDFDVPDEDQEPITPYEEVLMQEEYIEEPGDPVAEPEPEPEPQSDPEPEPEPDNT